MNNNTPEKVVSINPIANFLSNRIVNLRNSIACACKGLDNGHDIQAAIILSALSGMEQTVNALEDIIPLVESLGSSAQPNSPDFAAVVDGLEGGETENT